MTYTNETKITILIAEFYSDITNLLLQGALSIFNAQHIKEENIHIIRVSGAFELPQLAKKVAKTKRPDGILCLGCVIQGETPHFDIVAGESARGLMDVSIQEEIPVTNGILTTDTRDQAIARSGGSKGNKGEDCAKTLLEMIHCFQELEE